MKNKAERRVKLIKLLHEEGSMPTDKLAEKLKVCRATVCDDVSDLVAQDKVYRRRNETNIQYIVVIPDNCKAELYKRVEVGKWVEEQKRLGRKIPQ